MSQWLESLSGWLTQNPEWLGLAIFVIACVECLAIAGIIVPGTVLMFAVAVAAGGGALTLWQTLLLGYAGGLLGDALSYALGRRFHQNIRRLPVLRHHPEWMTGAESYFHKYGIASLLVGRFIGPLRPMLPMIAGMLDMPVPRFILVSLVAAAGWSIAYLMPGWATGAALRLPLPAGFWPEAGVVAAAFAVLIGLCAQQSLHHQRRTPYLAAALSAAILLGLFLGMPHLQALDNGLLAVMQDERAPHLDHLMVLITRLGDFNTQLFAGLLLCALLAIARQWRALLFAGSALLGTALLNGLLKHLFARTRPEVLLEPLHTYSFPSGHSSAAFAFFLVLGTLAGSGQPARLRLAWMVMACLPALAIAMSRVYLGVHWPTDVLAGAMLASALCAASLAAVQWREPLGALSPRAWWLILPACIALLGGVATWALPTAMQMYRY